MCWRERRCSPRSQSWRSEPEIRFAPTGGLGHEYDPQICTRYLRARSPTDDGLRTSSFIRHSGLVLSRMARLSCGCNFVYGSFSVSVVSSRRDCLAGSGVSEPHGRVYIRFVDCSVPVNFMTTVPLDKEMVANAGQNHARKLGGVTSETGRWRKPLGRTISIAIVAAAVILGLAVLYRQNYYPRTEDAEIFANFIGIAPQVDGPLIRLNVKDNQFVKKGELLYEIDERPYEYALENAVSEQSTLEGQVGDEQRKVAALESAVSVAQANIHS